MKKLFWVVFTGVIIALTALDFPLSFIYHYIIGISFATQMTKTEAHYLYTAYLMGLHIYIFEQVPHHIGSVLLVFFVCYMIYNCGKLWGKYGGLITFFTTLSIVMFYLYFFIVNYADCHV